MGRNTSVELTVGPGRRWTRAGVVLWTLAAVLLLVLGLSGRMPVPALVGGWLLLAVEPLTRRRAPAAAGVFRLVRDGSLTGPAGDGCWSAPGWTTRWLSVVPAVVGGRRHNLVIAAWRNDTDGYRVLRTWLRHPPDAAAGIGPEARIP